MAGLTAAQIFPTQRDPLIVSFNEKPPFFFTSNGKPFGILVSRAESILKEAGVSYEFESLPFNRIVANLQAQRPNFCALGFSKTAERGKFAVFSDPIYRDRTPVLVVRKTDAPNFQKAKTLRELLAGSTLYFGGKSGNAYTIDDQLARLEGRDSRYPVETDTLLEMLQLQRFDFTLLYPEEIEFYRSSTGLFDQRFAEVRFPDIPRGGYRYFVCSKQTHADVISGINRSIRKPGSGM
jgi:uncharacterized protein (TIGR02285 family)